MPIIMQDKDKIPKEYILLGKKEVTKKDCNGNDMLVHGLVLNDLVYVKSDGTTDTLQNMLSKVGGDQSAISVTQADGDVVTLLEIADSIDKVQFTIADLQAKYDAIN